MKKLFGKTLLLVVVGSFSFGCDIAHRIEERAASINNYERVSLALAKQNRELELEIGRLNDQIKRLEAQNHYLAAKLPSDSGQSGVERHVASISTGVPRMPEQNSVEWDLYQWSPEQLYSHAQYLFKKGDFKKSAEFFHALSVYYTDHKLIDDKFHYQAGIAAYESGVFNDWALFHMSEIMKNYPTSTFFRGAKLWTALTELNKGNDKAFFDTVEEFRERYRNTPEWRILSAHYQEIIHEFRPVRN